MPPAVGAPPRRRVGGYGIIWEVLDDPMGSWHGRTFVAKPMEISDSAFEQEVLKADKLVLVDFWAPWCGPCRTTGRVLDEIADERPDQVKVVKVNIDDHQEHAARFRVMSIPAMLLFKDGQPVDRLDGAHPKRNIVDRLERHLG